MSPLAWIDMTTTDDYLKRVNEIFAKLVAAPAESLSKAEILTITGSDDYDLIRRALLATDKVDPVPGRSGGLAVRRSQPNRREWRQVAEQKARRFLDGYELEPTESDAATPLAEIYEEWPQSKIAEALGVSQASISNWLRTRAVPNKYAAAILKLRTELKPSRGASEGKAAPMAEPHPPAAQYGDWLRAELERRRTNAVNLSAKTGIHINTILALLDGRTDRPQQRTRLSIEKALQESAPAEGAPVPSRTSEDDTWYYIGLPWTSDEIDQVPDEPGVYIIHDRLGRPAYVGVAHKGAGGIRARLRKHNELRWTADRRVAYTFSYALAARMPSSDPSMLAKALEKLLIKFMGNAILINERDVEDLAGAG